MTERYTVITSGQLASQSMKELDRNLSSCGDTTTAMDKAGLRWDPIRCLWFTTQYGRDRVRVLLGFLHARQAIRHARRMTRNPTFISAEAEVTKIGRCCHRCLRVNRKRHKEGQGFVCLVQQMREQENSPAQAKYRFGLNWQGSIVDND